MLVVFGLLLFFILNWWQGFKLKKLIKNYDESKDKSKKGEERRAFGVRGSELRGFPEPAKTELSSAGSVELERRKLLSPTTVEPDGKAISSTRKHSKLTRLASKFRKR